MIKEKSTEIGLRALDEAVRQVLDRRKALVSSIKDLDSSQYPVPKNLIRYTGPWERVVVNRPPVTSIGFPANRKFVC